MEVVTILHRKSEEKISPIAEGEGTGSKSVTANPQLMSTFSGTASKVPNNHEA